MSFSTSRLLDKNFFPLVLMLAKMAGFTSYSSKIYIQRRATSLKLLFESNFFNLSDFFPFESNLFNLSDFSISFTSFPHVILGRSGHLPATSKLNILFNTLSIKTNSHTFPSFYMNFITLFAQVFTFFASSLDLLQSLLAHLFIGHFLLSL